ncbi:MAG: excinuclease ABC subunit B, partial [Planctomycetota bacterium]
VLDADKEGFLRSATSLIQQMGRAARNVNATVVLYADRVTPAMQQAIDETERRRALQLAYNREHGVTPTQIRKAIRRGIERELQARRLAREALGADERAYQQEELLRLLHEEMLAAAEALEFEKAASLRDQIRALKAGAAVDSEGVVRRSELERAAAAAVASSRVTGKGGSRRRTRRR